MKSLKDQVFLIYLEFPVESGDRSARGILAKGGDDCIAEIRHLLGPEHEEINALVSTIPFLAGIFPPFAGGPV